MFAIGLVAVLGVWMGAKLAPLEGAQPSSGEVRWTGSSVSGTSDGKKKARLRQNLRPAPV
jgi:hypothetical protein